MEYYKIGIKDILLKWFTVLFYLSSILLANWLVNKFGIVAWGPLVFPAGAIAIGLTFSARDYVQKYYGKWGCWFWMGCACFITYLVNPQLALASVAAFSISELIDWSIFTFTKLSFKKRIILSNIFSTPADSILFVTIAFGFGWPAIIGQTIVKFASSALVLFIQSKKDDDVNVGKEAFASEVQIE